MNFRDVSSSHGREYEEGDLQTLCYVAQQILTDVSEADYLLTPADGGSKQPSSNELPSNMKKNWISVIKCNDFWVVYFTTLSQ
jgi:hypothetical protein